MEELKWNEQGLVCAVAQDFESGEVLMQAYMNEEAYRLTLETGYAHYWSRSRKKLWKKGEESGHLQKVRGIYLDCDKDCVLLKVEQTGAACHTGSYSCFFHARKGMRRGRGDAGQAAAHRARPQTKPRRRQLYLLPL